jgi:hypothetical protein
MQQNQIVVVRRDTGAKMTLKRDDAVEKILELLETIHNDMLKKYYDFDWDSSSVLH